jgi:hypothetical protein
MEDGERDARRFVFSNIRSQDAEGMNAARCWDGKKLSPFDRTTRAKRPRFYRLKKQQVRRLKRSERGACNALFSMRVLRTSFEVMRKD